MSSVVTVKINNQVFDNITRLKVARDLNAVAGTFEITLVDEARLRNALIAQIGQPSPNGPIKAGDPISIAIDSEVVLIGWIEQPVFEWESDRIECHIAGRDKTGDLVECGALPFGPTEFKGVDLLHVANLVCNTPDAQGHTFGIPVTADVDIGAPFDCLALHKHMTALAFLESAARQRSILLTSDGVGGLLLTRGGSSKAPAALSIGDNVQKIRVEYDWTKRFSDYFVTQDTTLRRTGGPALDSTVPPTDDADDDDDTPGEDSATEATAIGIMGHATDPEITRWRPQIRLTRSQSGMSTVQEQAEWACRVAKGESVPVRMPVLGFRAGPNNALWRPNQIASVWDPYSGIDRDMLIAGVTFERDETGDRTELRLVGPSAYDRINEADRKRTRRIKAASGPLTTTVPPEEAP